MAITRNNSEDTIPNTDSTESWFVRLLPVFKQHRWLISVIGVSSIAAIFFQVAIPPLVGNSIDTLSESIQSGETSAFKLSLIILVAAGFARSLMNYTVRSLLYRFSYSIECALRMAIFKKLNYLPLTFFSRMKPGDIISRSNSDMRAIQNFLLFVPYNVMVFMSFVLAIAYMLSINVTLALISMLPLPLTFLLSLRLRKAVSPLSWLIQHRTAEVTGVIDENIKGHAVVASLAKEQQQIELFGRMASKLRWANEQKFFKKARYSPLIERLVVFSQICVLLYGGWLVIDGQMLLGDLVAFNMYIIMMMIPFATLGDVLIMGREASVAAGRIFEILDEPLDHIYEARKFSMPQKVNELRFTDCCFDYGDRPLDGLQSQGVLNRFNCVFNKGEMTVVAGKTGCGKSTLALLLNRFYCPQAGSIEIDGIDIEQISLQSLRSGIGMVHQQGFLFNDTIRNNIAYAHPDASMAEVLAAARIAQVDKFVDELPDGYDTLVGENGSNLSGGQRQRVNIAQVILASPAILVLDEVTSALDLKTEDNFLTELKAAYKDKIVIFISHRLTVLEKADKVVFMEDGRAKGIASHTSLLSSKPWYAEFFKEFEEDEKESDSAEDGDRMIASIGQNEKLVT